MAPIGTVIKNGLFFLILLLPIAYLSAVLFSAAIVDLNFASVDNDGNPMDRRDLSGDQDEFYKLAIQEIALAIILLFGVGGLIFMKSLSDTVEDGMVEF